MDGGPVHSRTMTSSGGDDGTDPLDPLRRRLYAPRATAADVDRYVEAAGARPSTAESSPEAAPHVRRRSRTVIVVAALVVVGLLVAAITVGSTVHRSSAPTPAVRTAETQVLAVPAPPRAAFVRNLRAGRDAGLSAYFFAHPEARPAQLTTLQRAATEEHHGRGAQVVRLAPSSAADHGGRLTVILILADGGAAGWSASRTATGTGHVPVEQVVAAARDGYAPGAPAGVTVRYAGKAPDRLRVQAPEGDPFGVVAVFSN